MTSAWIPKFDRRQRLVFAGLFLAMLLIFTLDTITDYAIAMAVFYTAVILLATRLLPPRSVVALAGSCVILTVLSFALTQSGSYEVGVVNTGISIVAIGVTTYLSLQLVAAETSAHESRERLLRLARVTSLGELTASIAHEVNQPLTALVTSAGACKRWLSQQPPNLQNAERAIDRIVEEANRTSTIIARVRGLASAKVSRKAPFDLNAAVNEVVELARGEIDRQGIALRLYLRDSLAPALGDKVQIGQVIGNILLNAIEAVRGSPHGKEIEVTSTLADANTLQISVADTGTGFRAGEAEHVFDAFWTTKENGIGLGLTISRSIVEANGGHIWVKDNDGGGSVFFFTVPIAKGEIP